MGGLDTGFCSISRHDALPLPIPRNWFRFLRADILLCVGKGKLGAGEPWQGKRVGRGNRRAGSEISHDEHVEIFGIWVV